MTQDWILGIDAVSRTEGAAEASPAWSLSGPAQAGAASASAGTTVSTFGDVFSAGLQRLELDLQGQANAAAQLATGQTENLHQVMLKLEEGRIAFQFALQVRNRLLESYQDVMRMQI